MDAWRCTPSLAVGAFIRWAFLSAVWWTGCGRWLSVMRI